LAFSNYGALIAYGVNQEPCLPTLSLTDIDRPQHFLEETNMATPLIVRTLISVGVLASTFWMQDAYATAAFSRQTGEPCASCHMQGYGPWLTDYGTKFKLDGYVAGDAAKVPTLLNNFSAEIVASVTNVAAKVPSGVLPSTNVFQPNARTNLVNDWDSLYYTGRVMDKVGAYLQLQFNPMTARNVMLSMADLRYADHASLEGKNLQWGITANNAPTMSDTWMTSFAWMYPYTTSQVAPQPTAKPWLQTLMSNANTVGMTAYTKYDNKYYLEAGGYTSQASNMANGLGTLNGAVGASNGSSAYGGLLVGGAGYWRAYVEQVLGDYGKLMVGTFGLAGNVAPSYNSSGPTNYITEFNFDSNYMYMLDKENMFMVMTRYTRDGMTMSGSKQLGYAANASNNLNQIMAMAMYTYQQTYTLSFMWQDTWGSKDLCLYNGGCAAYQQGVGAVTGSANGSPNSNAFLTEIDYVPFGKGNFVTDPYMNLRFSLQYWAYTTFNGGGNNYDGNGRSAAANNTTYFVTNINF
jgi:hypothetical protein